MVEFAILQWLLEGAYMWDQTSHATKTGRKYSAAVSQLGFGSAIAQDAAAVALPKQSWLTAALYVAPPYFYCMRGFAAHVGTF